MKLAEPESKILTFSQLRADQPIQPIEWTPAASQWPTRYRVQLMGDRAREIVRLELMLEDASIKLSSVASSLKTVSARAILTAMINGESSRPA
jgi:hypothetical protein